MANFLFWVLLLCRSVIGIVFSLSLAGKLKNIPQFTQAVTSFDLVPQKFSSTVAYLILASEGFIVMCIVAGGMWLWIGFALTICTLLTFTIAMVSVLARNIRASCNCFGKKENPISYKELLRNSGLIVCGIIGWGTLVLHQGGLIGQVTIIVWILTLFITAIFAIAPVMRSMDLSSLPKNAYWIKKDLILMLLKGIRRSRIYRENIKHIASDYPDDIWHDEDLGWMITYPLKSADEEQIVLLVVQEDPSAVFNVMSAFRVSRDASNIINSVPII